MTPAAGVIRFGDVRPEPSRVGPLERSNGVVLLLMLVFGVIMTLGIFRPQRPSSRSAGSGFGVGFGSQSIMIGANPQDGAPR